jgi:hypothetical protein
MPVDPAALQTYLDPSYAEGLESRSLDELRSSRAVLQEAEGALSYVRRLVQGRLDIVASERVRRAEGGDSRSSEGLAPLLESLPSILADPGTRGGIGPGRLPQHLDPGETAAALLADLDWRVDPGRLTDLAALDDSELVDLTEELASIERQISDDRRRLHERIDSFQAELVRRYRSGEANIDSLLSRSAGAPDLPPG